MIKYIHEKDFNENDFIAEEVKEYKEKSYSPKGKKKTISYANSPRKDK